jgi:hypothetical protein
MSLTQSPTKMFEPNKKEIKYLAKRFPEFRQLLKDYVQSHYPNTYTDFNEASPGMIFIEMAAYIGDVLSFYIDNQFKENLILYAEEEKNVLSIAQSLGYKPRMTAPSTTIADVYQIVPALGVTDNYKPDSRYLLRILANSTFIAQESNNVIFRSLEDVDFNDPTDRTLSVIQQDTLTNVPLVYLVTKKIKLSSATIKTVTQTFGSPQKFSKITLPDSNVIGILDIKDSDGNTWKEVDYLAQDLIFQERDIEDTAANEIGATKTFRFIRTPRRYVTRINRNFEFEIQFGSGVNTTSEELVTLDSKQVATDYYQQKIANTSIDPVDFLNTSTYGLAPSNTTLTVRYLVGGGVESNVPSNTINTVDALLTSQETGDYAPNERATFAEILNSVAINNPEPATGGNGRESIDEIKQNAAAYFNSQNRVVTAQDYVVRTLAMPPSYGSVAKVYATSIDQVSKIVSITENAGQRKYVDDNAIPNAINLYVLGYNNKKKLTTLNSYVKSNLAKYLEPYRVLNDNVNILDGFVINIGVNFSIRVHKNYNMSDVLIRCIDAIKNYFDINKWQMNQPIYINDLNVLLNSIDGVRTVISLEIVNKYSSEHGSDYNDYLYPITEATVDNIVYPAADPSIFELRYPERDIVGSATQ